MAGRSGKRVDDAAWVMIPIRSRCATSFATTMEMSGIRMQNSSPP